MYGNLSQNVARRLSCPVTKAGCLTLRNAPSFVHMKIPHCANFKQNSKHNLKGLTWIFLLSVGPGKQRVNLNLIGHNESRVFIYAICLSVCLSVSLSTRMEQLGSHWTDFHEIWYLGIFRRYVQKIQVSLISDRNSGNVHEGLCTYMTVSRRIYLGMRNASDKSCRKTQNTHFISNNSFVENRAGYEILWKYTQCVY